MARMAKAGREIAPFTRDALSKAAIVKSESLEKLKQIEHNLEIVRKAKYAEATLDIEDLKRQAQKQIDSLSTPQNHN